MANGVEAGSTSKTDAGDAYNETSVKFPDDLSQVRYMEFNFYDSNQAEKVGRIVKDIAGASVGYAGEPAVEGLESTVTTIKGNPIFDGLGLTSLAEGIQEESTVENRGLNEETETELSAGITARNAVQSGIFKFAIYLPLVNNMREQITHSWKEDSGPVAGTLGEVVKPYVEQSSGNVGKMFGARTVMVNPDYTQTYEGSSLRAFVLNWVLMPNSRDEAETIFEIVRIFKRASSPQRTMASTMLLPPLFVNVFFANPKLQDALRMDEMLITGVSINYSETGFMETFQDGIPKAIMLEISVNERRMRTQDTWASDPSDADDGYSPKSSQGY